LAFARIFTLILTDCPLEGNWLLDLLAAGFIPLAAPKKPPGFLFWWNKP
jgi:hypothetical protein